MNLYVYIPNGISYMDNGIEIIKGVFNIDKKNMKVITKLPYSEEINNSVFWICSHGFDREKFGDFLIEGPKEVKRNYYDYLVVNDREVPFIPSKNLTKFFNVKNSVIIFDSCYSSEIYMRTLSEWKSNLIFTTGYIPDTYNETWSGLLKSIVYVASCLKQNRGINSLDYNNILANKDFINDYYENVLNKEHKTQFILF